jgi:Holliday junction resolvase RusA-like endonuclease
VREIEFMVYCKAEPQGSKRAFVVPGKQGAKARAVVVDTDKKAMKSYRSQVTNEALVAMQAYGMKMPLAEKHVPIGLRVEFTFLKPPSVPRSRAYPVVMPDIDKCLRATMDALAGVLYLNDAQVVRAVAEKTYGPVEKVFISARTM